MAKRRQEHGYGQSLHEPMLRGDLSAWYGWWPEQLSTAEVMAGWKSALGQRGRPGSPSTLQLYAHFALCQSSCVFCQYFHVVPREREQVERYTDYLVALVGRSRAALGRVDVSNAYFGGGTPSALPADQLERFLAAFQDAFRVKSEFSCEGHPGNLNEDKLALLARAGVNRLSMGLQSLDPIVCRRIGRMNPPLERVGELVRSARRLGMWVNTDLVLGLPSQTAESFLADLDRLLAECRPDCLTVYRYQPVPHLAHAPSDAMRYSRVLTPGVLWRAARKGYLPATTGGDERPGKDFFRNSTRTWRQWLDRLTSEAIGLVRSDAELPSYAQFEHNHSHILGLGPGAMSHIYGHSWYREITAVANLTATSAPVYLGTRVTPEDECRSALLQAFGEGRWIDPRALGRRSGVDVDTTFAGLLAEGRRSGALRRVGRWYACAPGASSRTHPTFFESLLPAITPDAAARDRRAAEVTTLRAHSEVQRELVSIGSHLTRADRQPGGVGTRSQLRSDEALFAWAELIALGAPGQRFADAVIDRIGGGEVHFRVRPEPAPVLRVIVERADGQPSFLCAGPYSISYIAHAGASLAPVEEQFLIDLGARTTAALGAAAVLPTTAAGARRAPT